jgi:hypothetical protein
MEMKGEFRGVKLKLPDVARVINRESILIELLELPGYSGDYPSSLPHQAKPFFSTTRTLMFCIGARPPNVKQN